MPDDLDQLLDDLFQGCAFAAWLHEAALTGRRPESEATRERAYRYYEEALAEKNASRDGRSETRSFDADESVEQRLTGRTRKCS